MVRRLGIVATLAVFAVPAFADMQPMTGADLAAAVSGKTIQGKMTTSGDYTEYYAPDGTVKGKGYTGTWRVNDNNQLCVKYSSNPDESCWHGRVENNNVTWYRDGREDGGGAIADGDAGGFRDSDNVGGRR